VIPTGSISIDGALAYSPTVGPFRKNVSELLKEGFMTESPSSLWRTAYVSAIFETDPAKMTLKIADARAAIAERLNSPVEIGKLEHEAIEVARQRLATMKARPVEVVKLALSTGDTPASFGPYYPAVPFSSPLGEANAKIRFARRGSLASPSPQVVRVKSHAKNVGRDESELRCPHMRVPQLTLTIDGDPDRCVPKSLVLKRSFQTSKLTRIIHAP